MAKRKKAYGATGPEHKRRAGGDIDVARYYASAVRRSLANGDCERALASLGSLNRSIGEASAHLRFARGTKMKSVRGGGGMYLTRRSLEMKFKAKCVR